MACLRIEKLSFCYPEKRLKKGLRKNCFTIDNFTAEINPAEIVALLGDSGSGKSTILRLLTGLELPDSGLITLDDRILFKRDSSSRTAKINLAPQKRDIGLIFQDYALFPHLNVKGNIGFALPKKSDKKLRVAELLDIVCMSEHADKYPHQLSGGQQQRVAIARAIAADPKVLLLDEPFSNLDAQLREAVRTEVRDIIKSAGLSAILVTHDEEDVKACADRRIEL
jgi:iron(III) transport system ATP-binding protein